MLCDEVPRKHLESSLFLCICPFFPLNASNLDIYIYICCRVKTWSKIAFFESKFGPSFLCFPFFFKNIILFAGRMRFSKTSEEKKRQELPFFESKLGPIMLRHILGPSFDATLDQVLTQHFWQFWSFFHFSKYAETTFYSVSAKICFFKPNPKN